MAAVRGIGVAVITSTSGTASPAPLSRSAARCSTPKRCCSSITTTPRRAERDLVLDQRVGADQRCRPSRRPGRRARPCARPPVTRLVSSSTRSGAVAEQAAPDRARSRPASRRAHAGGVLLGQHLGRRHQRALVPALHARRAARSRRRRVLPAPTSPCSRRCIGCGPARSASISAIARCWAPVSGKGSAAWNRADELAVDDVADAPGVALDAPACAAPATSCSRSSSSKASRRRAAPWRAIDSGAWIAANAPVPVDQRRAGRARSAGSGSAKLAAGPVERLLDPAGDLPRR